MGLIMKKDNYIIGLLIIFFLFSVWTISIVDTEIDGLNKTIDYLLAENALQSDRITNLEQYQGEQDERMSDIEHEQRVQHFSIVSHREQLDDNATMFTDLIDSVEHLEEYMRSLPDNALGLNISAEEEYLIASLVYLEAGGQGCSYELKKAIASVFFNQMIYFGTDVTHTIYRAGAFSVASRVRSTTPSASCRMAVREVLENGTTLPRRVLAFQLGGYHSFGTPYRKIQNVYFSYM